MLLYHETKKDFKILQAFCTYAVTVEFTDNCIWFQCKYLETNFNFEISELNVIFVSFGLSGNQLQ